MSFLKTKKRNRFENTSLVRSLKLSGNPLAILVIPFVAAPIKHINIISQKLRNIVKERRHPIGRCRNAILQPHCPARRSSAPSRRQYITPQQRPWFYSSQHSQPVMTSYCSWSSTVLIHKISLLAIRVERLYSIAILWKQINPFANRSTGSQGPIRQSVYVISTMGFWRKRESISPSRHSGRGRAPRMPGTQLELENFCSLKLLQGL